MIRIATCAPDNAPGLNVVDQLVLPNYSHSSVQDLTAVVSSLFSCSLLSLPLHFATVTIPPCSHHATSYPLTTRTLLSRWSHNALCHPDCMVPLRGMRLLSHRLAYAAKNTLCHSTNLRDKI